MNQQVTKRENKNREHSPKKHKPAPATVIDHIRELQGRIFWIVLTFIIIAAAAYPFFGTISDVILAPLSKEQELVYLTPGGAFSFIIQVCLYVGIIGALPVIIFHVYRFLMPAVREARLRTVLKFTIASFVLAAAGILFAYFVSLPAALYFLTGFNLYHINPMLTIDSYFSFVMTYVLAGALLFQLPIIIMIIDSFTPLTPTKMMGAQGKILVGSFIVAAIISPTPDALNQALLASPIVIMYQLGIMLIWIRSRKRRKIDNSTVTKQQPLASPAPVKLANQQAAVQMTATAKPQSMSGIIGRQPTRLQRSAMKPLSAKPHQAVLRGSIDGVKRSAPPRHSLQVIGAKEQPLPKRPVQLSISVPQRPAPSINYGCSIDGIMVPSRPSA